MGGGTMHIDIPIIPIKHSSSSSSSSSSHTDYNKSINNNLNLPVSYNYAGAVKTSCSASHCYCRNETCRGKLKAVYGKEDKQGSGFLISSSVFGSVPSQFEVQTAITALLNFMLGINSSQSELQWLQKLLDSCITRKLFSYGHRKAYEAFQLLQTDPSVQKLVVSLSSDKALWDAVTNNELVKRLLEPPTSGLLPQSPNKEPDLAECIIGWIMEMTKAIVMEVIEKFQSLVHDVFLSPETKRGNPATQNGEFEEKIRSSLLLSIVTLLIVVVARLQMV